MPEPKRQSVVLRSLVGFAAFCIAVAGLRLAREIVVPVLLAMVFAVICLPTLKWFQDRKVPNWISITLILLGITAVGVTVPVFVGASLRQLVRELDVYYAQYEESRADLVRRLTDLGVEDAESALKGWIDPKESRRALENAGKEAAVLVVKTFIVLILVAFMLAEASHFHSKVHAAFPESSGVGGRVTQIIENIWRYLAIKSVISLGTGVLVYIMLAIIGVKFALLWGFVAFCLNYIPNVGSVIASVPAVMLAFLDFGPLAAIGVVVGYLVINNVMGSVIEPRWQGHGLGLSPLVVLVSLLFWYFTLDIVGALLSAPLTMAAKIACEAYPETHWIAVMLGPKVKETSSPTDTTKFA